MFTVFDPRSWFDSGLSGLGWFDPILGTEPSAPTVAQPPYDIPHSPQFQSLISQ